MGEGHVIAMACRAAWRSQPECIANGRSQVNPLRRLHRRPWYYHCAGNSSLSESCSQLRLRLEPVVQVMPMLSPAEFVKLVSSLTDLLLKLFC